MCERSAEYLKSIFIKWLIQGNLDFDYIKDAIGAEVPFSYNRRNADLLIISEELHALEIKGDFDDIRKLKDQLEDYHLTFDKVSVITTPKHIKKIRNIIKPYTGLIIFENNTFIIKRKPQRRKRLDKYSLLMFLHKNELTKILRPKNSSNLSTDQIRNLLVSRENIENVRNYAYTILRNRYKKLFNLFLNDTGGKILWDEIRSLSGQISNLS